MRRAQTHPGQGCLACTRSLLAVLTTVVFLFGLSPAVIGAQATTDAEKPQKLVEQSVLTLAHFANDPEMIWFRRHIDQAHGILIVPRLLKGGFFVGGSGGSGVLLARDEKSGTWSNPAFFTVGAATFGIQIGAESSEMVLLVMTDKGIDSFLATSFKPGGSVSAAAGPVGAGMGVKTADVMVFARAKGAYAGATLEGAVIKTRDDLNAAYYGKPVRTVDIIVRRDVGNPHADMLRDKLKQIAE